MHKIYVHNARHISPRAIKSMYSCCKCNSIPTPTYLIVDHYQKTKHAANGRIIPEVTSHNVIHKQQQGILEPAGTDACNPELKLKCH